MRWIIASRVEPFGIARRTGPAARAVASVDRVHDRRVAVPAGRLRHRAVRCRNPERVGEAAGGEVERMPEAVASLDEVLPHRRVRRMAVVAGGGGVMAALDPCLEVLAHDVAVGTGLGIVRQVGVAARNAERVPAEADGHAGEGGSDKGEPAASRRHPEPRSRPGWWGTHAEKMVPWRDGS